MSATALANMTQCVDRYWIWISAALTSATLASTSSRKKPANSSRLIGIGSMYLFTRTTGQNHPLDGCVQMT